MQAQPAEAPEQVASHHPPALPARERLEIHSLSGACASTHLGALAMYPRSPIFKRIFEAPLSSRRQNLLSLPFQALMALPVVHFSGTLAGAFRSPTPRLTLAANLRTARVCCAASNPAKAAGEKGARGIMKPRPVSQAMQEVIGVSEISRAHALKEIWAYIKEHDLQFERLLD
ncbi:hypothetical protein ACLOJK_038215 [Asimina triloba]